MGSSPDSGHTQDFDLAKEAQRLSVDVERTVELAREQERLLAELELRYHRTARWLAVVITVALLTFMGATVAVLLTSDDLVASIALVASLLGILLTLPLAALGGLERRYRHLSEALLRASRTEGRAP